MKWFIVSSCCGGMRWSCTTGACPAGMSCVDTAGGLKLKTEPAATGVSVSSPGGPKLGKGRLVSDTSAKV